LRSLINIIVNKIVCVFITKDRRSKMKIVTTALLSLFAATTTTTTTAIEVGERIPKDLTLHHGFPPENISLDERFANKNVLLIGLPGAFTPTWSSRQVPGYLANESELKNVGVDDVIIYSVNDAAVVLAWAEDQGVSQLPDADADASAESSSNSIVHLFADPYSAVTEALELEMTASGPKMVGLLQRCKRHALYIVDGVVQIKRVAEAEDDPAGDEYPDITLAESMIIAIQELNNNNNSKSSSADGEL